MKSKTTKGPRTIRLLAHKYTPVVLNMIVFIVVGLVREGDINPHLPGATAAAVERSYVDQALVKRKKRAARSGEADRRFGAAVEGAHSDGGWWARAQKPPRTIDQLLGMRRLSIEKAAVLPGRAGRGTFPRAYRNSCKTRSPTRNSTAALPGPHVQGAWRRGRQSPGGREDKRQEEVGRGGG